jgi:hypothetical protein
MAEEARTMAKPKWARFIAVDEVLEVLSFGAQRQVVTEELLRVAPNAYRWRVSLATVWRHLPALVRQEIVAAWEREKGNAPEGSRDEQLVASVKVAADPLGTACRRLEALVELQVSFEIAAEQSAALKDDQLVSVCGLALDKLRGEVAEVETAIEVEERAGEYEPDDPPDRPSPASMVRAA